MVPPFLGVNGPALPGPPGPRQLADRFGVGGLVGWQPRRTACALSSTARLAKGLVPDLPWLQLLCRVATGQFVGRAVPLRAARATWALNAAVWTFRLPAIAPPFLGHLS